MLFQYFFSILAKIETCEVTFLPIGIQQGLEKEGLFVEVSARVFQIDKIAMCIIRQTQCEGLLRLLNQKFRPHSNLTIM